MSNTLPVIYVLDASVDVTGAFVSARSNAHALKDHADVILVLPEGSSIPQSELHGFKRVEYIPLVNLSKRFGALITYFPALLTGSFELRRLMKSDGCERLQLNDFFLMQGAVLRLLGYRGHIATWVRCDPKRFAGPLAGIMLALARKSANIMVAVSSYIQSLLPASYRVEVLYNFYTGQTRAARTWSTTEEKTIVYVGNYIAGKGQDVALEAFAIAAAKDASLRLAFYGSDMGLQKNREFRQQLEAKAQALGINGRVAFHGFIEGTYPVLENAYAALNCSVSESFSRTVLEASGAGVAVIATMSGGPQEIIREGETGYLVPVGDTQAIAGKLLLLAADPALTARMGEAGATHVKARFGEAGVRGKLIHTLAL